MSEAKNIREVKTPEEMEKLGYTIYPPVLPSYAGMISQEHAETVLKLLAASAVDYHVSTIGCNVSTMAIYAKFETVEKQKTFEEDITPYQFVQLS